MQRLTLEVILRTVIGVHDKQRLAALRAALPPILEIGSPVELIPPPEVLLRFGMWRRRAIDEAGGWQHDTLTEDTDLSYRAQLKGWKFVYLQDVECPAELPVEMTAFKTQQARWAKGLIQTGKKILPEHEPISSLPDDINPE